MPYKFSNYCIVPHACGAQESLQVHSLIFSILLNGLKISSPGHCNLMYTVLGSKLQESILQNCDVQYH